MTGQWLVIGRFQPLCEAHLAVMRALPSGSSAVVLGAEMPRSARYPFRAEEQVAMLASEGFTATPLPEALRGETYAAALGALMPDGPLSLLCFDAVAGAMLKTVWTRGAVRIEPEPSQMADRVRTGWLGTGDLSGVPASARAVMDTAMTADEREVLTEEQTYLSSYKESWVAAPYPPVLVTVDALIYHQGRVLLIRRGGLPGRGQWALPGGFLDEGETVFSAALRELREETGLDVSETEARACLRGQHVFDAPDRSARGRTLTHAFFFDLSDLSLPVLAAGDDAAALKWVGMDCALKMRAHMFEDHFLILSHFLAPDTV